MACKNGEQQQQQQVSARTQGTQPNSYVDSVKTRTHKQLLVKKKELQ